VGLQTILFKDGFVFKSNEIFCQKQFKLLRQQP